MFLVGLFLVGGTAELGRWFLAALIVAGALMLYQQHLIKERNPQQCLAAFLNNAWAGAVVFAGIALDYYL